MASVVFTGGVGGTSLSLRVNFMQRYNAAEKTSDIEITSVEGYDTNILITFGIDGKIAVNGRTALTGTLATMKLACQKDTVYRAVTDAAGSPVTGTVKGLPHNADGSLTLTFSLLKNGYSNFYIYAYYNSTAYTRTFDDGTAQSIAGVTYYNVSYDANGGTGAPATQAKAHGVSLTLSSAKPSRASLSETYTVTLNANGGSCQAGSLQADESTKYTFTEWNTRRDGTGTGTSYAPGAAYTQNAAATLYAQWSSTVTVGTVTLPTPTRSGYAFLGWATNPDAKTGVTGNYTPAGNVTLYAVWKSKGLVSVRHGGRIRKCRAYVKHNGVWRAMVLAVRAGTDWRMPG